MIAPLLTDRPPWGQTVAQPWHQLNPAEAWPMPLLNPKP